jgi:hypothetical protein
MERFRELCTIWTETVKFALDDLKEVRNHFEVCFPFTDFIKVLIQLAVYVFKVFL